MNDIDELKLKRRVDRLDALVTKHGWDELAEVPTPQTNLTELVFRELNAGRKVHIWWTNYGKVWDVVLYPSNKEENLLTRPTADQHGIRAERVGIDPETWLMGCGRKNLAITYSMSRRFIGSNRSRLWGDA